MKTTFSAGAIFKSIAENTLANSDWQAEEKFHEAILVDYKPSLSKRVNRKKQEVDTGVIVFRIGGEDMRTWVDDKVVNVTESDIGEEIMVGYVEFEASTEYKKGGIKVGDKNAMVRSVKKLAKSLKTEELDFASKATIFAQACAKAGVSPTLAGI